MDKHASLCACTKRKPAAEADMYLSLTQRDYPRPPRPSYPHHHYRMLQFCTPITHTGGPWQAPMSLTCSTSPVYTSGEAGPDSTSGTLAQDLPCSWAMGAGVPPGRDRNYKQQINVPQVLTH